MNYRTVKCLAIALSTILAGRLSLLAQDASANAKTAQKTVKVLAVGNSFAGNANKYCKKLNEADPDNQLLLTVAYIGGCPLDKHVKLAKINEENPDDPKASHIQSAKQRKALRKC